MARKFFLSSEPLIFLYTIIFTINYTVLPQLVLQKICLQNNNYNQTTCKDLDNVSDDLQKKSATWWFYLLTCSLVPSVFTVLIWGPVTDAIGRKRAMVFVPLINGTRSLVYLLNSYFLNAHVGYLLFGSFLSCFYGEFQGVIALCYAYMADLTTENLENRTMRMAFIEAGVFFAGIPAGLLSGYLLEQIGYVPVFILTVGVNFVILLYVLCFLPDSVGTKESSITPFLGEESNTKSKDADCIDEVKQEVKCMDLFNPIKQIRQVFKVITHHESRRVVLPLLCAFGLSVCAVLGELIVQTLYLKNKPFVFSPQKIGYYAAVQSTIRGFGVISVTQLSHHIFHFNDYTLIFIGLLSQIVCYVLIGLSHTTIVVFLVNIAGLAVPVATASLRSLVTKQVSEEHYGAVLASIEAIDAIAGVFTNALSLWTYNLTLSIYTGVVFFGLSGFSVLSFLVVLFSYCRHISVEMSSS